MLSDTKRAEDARQQGNVLYRACRIHDGKQDSPAIKVIRLTLPHRMPLIMSTLHSHQSLQSSCSTRPLGSHPPV